MNIQRAISIGLLCSVVTSQPIAFAVTVMHSDRPTITAPKSSRDTTRRSDEAVPITGTVPAKGSEQVANPLKLQHVENLSLIDTGSGAKAQDSGDKKTKSSKTTTTTDTTKSASTKGKSWDQKTKEAAAAPVPKNIQEAAKHFTKTIETYWNTWTNGTGVLTIVEIGQLINNPDITGKEAAALSALADYFYKLNRSVTSVKKADSKDSYTLKELQSAMGDLSGHGYANEALADDYRTALLQIKQDTTSKGFSLFGKKNPPKYGENVQWNVCDCYFVSAVNEMLRLDPTAIVSMIKQIPPDTFEVYFAGYKDGKVPVKITLTQGDIAMFSHTRDGGCYLAVLGRAADRVMRLEHDDHSKVGNKTPLGTMVDEGSHWKETNTFHLLTGKSYAQINTKDYTPAELESLIKYALKHHEYIGLGEAYSPVSKHYLIITGYHDGMVDVLNPWGQTRYYSPLGDDRLPFLPNMAKPTANGGHVFHMVRGHFEVPIKDVMKWGFGSMTFQRHDLRSVLGDDKAKSTGQDASKKDSDTTVATSKDDAKKTDATADSKDDSKKTDATADSKDDSKKTDATADRKDDSKDSKEAEKAESLEVSKKDFDRVVQKHWDQWTAGSDGNLNLKEIGKLLRDPNITGAEAAVLGALALTLTQTEVDKGQDPGAVFSEAQVLSNAKDSRAVKYFKDAKEQLRGDTNSKGISVYGKTGHPDWQEVRQWKLGDCWFVSVVDAILRKYGPDYVEKMITQDPSDPNKFTVKFPGYDKTIEVTLTQGEIAMFSHTVKDGSWLAVLGMALNTVVEQRQAKAGKPEDYKSWYPFGHVVNGGSNLLTYKLFTDKRYTRIPTDNVTALEAAMRYAEAHSDPIGVNTHGHDLSIRKIDWTTGEVEIQNPWGTEQVYKTNNKSFKMGPDGTFWVPIADLSKYGFIKVEVPKVAVDSDPKSTEKSSDTKTAAQDSNHSTTGAAQDSKISDTATDDSHELAVPTSEAKDAVAAERSRLDEQIEELADDPTSDKALISSLESSLIGERSKVDQLAATLSKSSLSDKSTAAALQASVSQARLAVDKQLATVDPKLASAIKDQIASERKAVDQEVATLDKLSEDFARGSSAIDMNQGSAFVAHQGSVSLRSPNALVDITKDSIAFVVSLNGATVAYNLGEHGTVNVDPGTGDTIVVQPGHAVVVAGDKLATADQANPLPAVAFRNVVPLGLHNNQNCFDIIFPYTTLLKSAPQIAPLFESKKKEDQKLADALVKRAAAMEVLGN